MTRVAPFLLALALCGCKTQQSVRHVVAAALPPEPMAAVFAVPAQPEWSVPNVHPGIGPSHLVVENGVGYVSFDTNLLCFLVAQPNSQRVLLLDHWSYGNTDNSGGFGVSGNVLLLSADDPAGGPNHVQEYTLTDWVGGLPTRAVFVTQRDYSTSKGSFSRVAKFPSGRLMAVTTRQQGWTYDTIDRAPNGVYTTNFFSLLPWPSPGNLLELAVREDDAGRPWLFGWQDASEGTVTLTRFCERDGKLALYDFNPKFVYKTDGALAADNECVWAQITDDARFISYQAAKDSITACQPTWYRFCHVNIVETEIFQPVGGHIFPTTVHNDGGQNLWWTQTWKADETYVSQASTNLTDWLDLNVLSRTPTAPGRAEFHSTNPYFFGGQPLPRTFYVKSTPLNYRRSLRHTTPEFAERSFSYCSLVSLPNNGIGYFLMPFNVPACTQQDTQWRIVGSPDVSPCDYARFSQGYGWAFIKRGGQYFLKKLA